MYYYGWCRLTMVKERRCSMGGGREETCINMGGGNSL